MSEQQQVTGAPVRRDRRQGRALAALCSRRAFGIANRAGDTDALYRLNVEARSARELFDRLDARAQALAQRPALAGGESWLRRELRLLASDRALMAQASPNDRRRERNKRKAERQRRRAAP